MFFHNILKKTIFVRIKFFASFAKYFFSLILYVYERRTQKFQDVHQQTYKVYLEFYSPFALLSFKNVYSSFMEFKRIIDQSTRYIDQIVLSSCSTSSHFFFVLMNFFPLRSRFRFNNVGHIFFRNALHPTLEAVCG